MIPYLYLYKSYHKYVEWITTQLHYWSEIKVNGNESEMK